jgi:error-prone DNA polymerase
MICRADTVGVFQIESRAQMSMLPRLQPRCFYDLVIEVAIVRPGPIQGGMVHPYLRREQGQEPVDYPRARSCEGAGRTLGVPIFQEQVMQIAMLAAGFTPGEADQLRRAMAAWKRKGGLHRSRAHDRRHGERGYAREFAEASSARSGLRRIRLPRKPRRQLRAAGLRQQLAQVPRAGAFLAALLNSQPMGFYAPHRSWCRTPARHGVAGPSARCWPTRRWSRPRTSSRTCSRHPRARRSRWTTAPPA